MATERLSGREPLWLSAADQYAVASIADCADALAVVLGASSDPEVVDPPRTALIARSGQLLVMPSTSTDHIGVKLVTIANPEAGQQTPRIQGIHVQFDAHTLAPRAILDGIALTMTRTAAVSVVALRALAHPDSSELLVFGAGPQASAHIRGICAEWPIAKVRIVSRRAESARRVAGKLSGELGAIQISALTSDAVSVADADIIVCATTSASPIFVQSPRERSAIVAVGSHSPTARELPGRLMQHAYVAVEDRPTAMRDAGDIVMAISEGFMAENDIDADLRELVRGAAVDTRSPRVFKSVGMAWQDAVVANAILARV